MLELPLVLRYFSGESQMVNLLVKECVLIQMVIDMKVPSLTKDSKAMEFTLGLMVRNM